MYVLRVVGSVPTTRNVTQHIGQGLSEYFFGSDRDPRASRAIAIRDHARARHSHALAARVNRAWRGLRKSGLGFQDDPRWFRLEPSPEGKTPLGGGCLRPLTDVPHP